MKKRSIFGCFIKYGLSILLCMMLLVNTAPAAQASTGVPQEVRDAADSVVLISFMVDMEDFTPENQFEIRWEYPDSIFEISGKEYYEYATGSGFIFKNSGNETLIATNNHVVTDEDYNGEIYVWLSDNRRVHADVIFAVPEKDLAVVRIRETTSKKALPLAEKDAQRGDAVYAVGFPGASDVLSDTAARSSESATITDGIISVIHNFTIGLGSMPVSILQINAAVNQGNSGGPLLDAEGTVVGINTFTVNVGQDVHGAVAVSELLSLLEEYGIEIPSEETSVETEPTGPVISPKPKESVGQTKMILVCAVIVSAVVLSLFLRPKGKELSSSADVDSKGGVRKSDEMERIPDNRQTLDDYIVTPKIDNTVDVEIKLTGTPKKSAGEKSLADEYFKGIKL